MKQFLALCFAILFVSKHPQQFIILCFAYMTLFLIAFLYVDEFTIQERKQVRQEQYVLILN